MTFRRDSTRERTATVPTAAAKIKGIIRKIHIYPLVGVDLQGRRGVKVVNVSAETTVT